MKKPKPFLKSKSMLFRFVLIISIVFNVLMEPFIASAASTKYVTSYSLYMYSSKGKIDFSHVDFSQGVNLIEVNQKGLNVGDFLLYQKVTTKKDLQFFSEYIPVRSSKQVTYKSSNPAIASVSKTGNVTFKKTGEVCIAVKLKNDSANYTYYFPVRVMEKNARLETKLGDFNAYRNENIKSTKACKTFLKTYNSKLSTKNLAKQYTNYVTFQKNNPYEISGCVGSGDVIVPGKYRLTPEELPKDYIKKWLHDTEIMTLLGLDTVHQCDIYAIDATTYQIVPDYLFKPADSFYMTIYGNDGQAITSEILSKQTPQGEIASFDYDTQTIKIHADYADAFLASMDISENTLELDMEKEESQICNYSVIYEPSILKTPAYAKIMDSQIQHLNPLNYDAKNKLQIKSIVATKSGGTITLKNKITAEQLIEINIEKRGKAEAKNINLKIYLIEFNGFYTPDKTNVIPVTLTLKKGSSTIKMKYSKNLKKYHDYILSETPNQPSLCWFYDENGYTSITPLK